MTDAGLIGSRSRGWRSRRAALLLSAGTTVGVGRLVCTSLIQRIDSQSAPQRTMRKLGRERKRANETDTH